MIPGLLANIVVSSVPQSNVFYYHNDHLGTPRKITDENGVVVWSADYLPFGEASAATADLESNFRFPGQYHDAESGLHYNYYRYYDSSTGGYLTPDPIGQAGGINLYPYVQNDPINRVDPSGLSGTVAVSPFGPPLILSNTPEQLAANKALADATWKWGKEHYNPDNYIAQAYRYLKRNLDDDPCDIKPADPTDLGPLKGAPGLAGSKPPGSQQPHDPDWWERPPDWDKKTKWQKIKWVLKKAVGALTGAGGAGI